jgi:hypothetical protein
MSLSLSAAGATADRSAFYSYSRRQNLRLFSSGSNNADDDSDLDLGDWRKFRASLIAQEEEGSTDDEGDGKKKSPKLKKPVAKENELILAKQNSELAKEYKSGVWAHLIAEPEVGGLICRMPIEGELYWGTGFWKEKLDTLLKIDIMGPPESLMAHWFQMAERMLARELDVITASAKNGVLNPNDLEDDAKVLLEMYLDYKQTWQEVCLVLGSTQALVINRPISRNINKELAKLLLEGQPQETVASTSSINDNNGTEYPFGFLDRFVGAFSEGAVYMGGPDLQAEPALVVHGIANLDGATELAPGTGIYLGGLEAAVDGVLEGKYKPLDFRFFLGRKVYENGATLKQKVDHGAYKPVACNRSLALKQCLGLPKPLWHEGMLLFSERIFQ